LQAETVRLTNTAGAAVVAAPNRRRLVTTATVGMRAHVLLPLPLAHPTMPPHHGASTHPTRVQAAALGGSAHRTRKRVSAAAQAWAARLRSPATRPARRPHHAAAGRWHRSCWPPPGACKPQQRPYRRQSWQRHLLCPNQAPVPAGRRRHAGAGRKPLCPRCPSRNPHHSSGPVACQQAHACPMPSQTCSGAPRTTSPTVKDAPGIGALGRFSLVSQSTRRQRAFRLRDHWQTSFVASENRDHRRELASA